MRVAAIDIGSNSVHMVLADTDRSGAIRVVGREKEMVRLGARALSRGRLGAAAMKRGLLVLRRYAELARAAGADKVIAAATSAVREAGNGEDFLDLVGRETGIWPRAVSGEQGARLIFLAAAHSIPVEGGRSLVVDIGGGSVELAVGRGAELDLAVSERIGVLRLAEEFVKTDPLSTRNETRLVKHLDSVLKRHVAKIRDIGFETVVGTSGTVLALGGLALERGGQVPENLHHEAVSADDIHTLRRWLVGLDARARLRIPGLDETRVDIIVPGAILLDTLLQRLGVKEIVLSEWALREGLLLDYLHRHPRTVDLADAYPDVRERSVVELAERCAYDEKHARQVARLALALFEGTRRQHGLGDAERALLRYAALLHDIGRHISYTAHHKHSCYLIKNGDLRGFSPVEVEVLASVARYQRRGRPSKKHSALAELPRAERRVVEVLAALLRLAVALDRSRRQVVKDVTVGGRGKTVRVSCHVSGDASLELWGVPARAALLERALGVTVKVDIAPAARIAAAEPRLARARAARS